MISNGTISKFSPNILISLIDYPYWFPTMDLILVFENVNVSFCPYYHEKGPSSCDLSKPFMYILFPIFWWGPRITFIQMTYWRNVWACSDREKIHSFLSRVKPNTIKRSANIKNWFCDDSNIFVNVCVCKSVWHSLLLCKLFVGIVSCNANYTFFLCNLSH